MLLTQQDNINNAASKALEYKPIISIWQSSIA
jgi:hypothetical protein